MSCVETRASYFHLIVLDLLKRPEDLTICLARDSSLGQLIPESEKLRFTWICPGNYWGCKLLGVHMRNPRSSVGGTFGTSPVLTDLV